MDYHLKMWENLGRFSKAWWMAAAKGAVKWLPMSHKLLSNLKWLQPGLQQNSMAGQVLAAGECVLQVVQVGDKSSLQEEFVDFCTSPLPPKVTAITEVNKYRHAISQIRECLETEYRYTTLAKLVKAILVIPHGNTDTECLFSHIGLNKMKHRNRLGISTLNSLLTVHFNVPQKCYEFKPNTELLKTYINAMTHFNMLFLMKLLFGFCLDFLLPKKLDNTDGWFGNYQTNYGNTEWNLVMGLALT